METDDLNECSHQVQEALDRGDFLAALPLLDRLIAARPDDLDLLNSRACVQMELGDVASARDCLDKLLALDPHHALGHHNMARLLDNLGQPTSALAHHWSAYLNAPEDLADKLLHSHAIAAQQAGQWSQAYSSWSSLLQLRPQNPMANSQLALVCEQLGLWQESLDHHHLACHAHPEDPVLWNNLGSTLHDLSRPEEALLAYNQALSLDPANSTIRFNRSVTHLLLGQWREGWEGFESRPTKPALPAPPWKGQADLNRSLLVLTEQGLGDALQFARYLPLVRERVGHLTIACPPPLTRFFAKLSCVDTVCPTTSPRPCDFAISLLSLPSVLGECADPLSVPHTSPLAIPHRSSSPPRIGIAWKGNPAHAKDRFRSIPDHLFLPFLQTVPARWISLLPDPLPPSFVACGVETLTSRMPSSQPRDVLALIEDITHLEGVIAVDTLSAHAALAAGVPCWILLSTNNDWRWGRSSSSPFYPQAHLLRQHQIGDWSTLIADTSARWKESLR